MPLHPIIQPQIERWYQHGMPGFTKLPINKIRKLFKLANPTPKLAKHSHTYDLGYNRKIRVFNPSKADNCAPLVIFIRPSAYILGELDHSSFICQYIARKLRCKTAAIEHRLAPEYKYPIPLDDCEYLIKWIYNNSDLIGYDNSKISLWGESAGAHLSAAICHRFKLQKNSIIKHHVMYYPPLNYSFDATIKQQNAEGYILDSKTLDYLITSFINDDSERLTIDISPGLDADFSNLPATTIAIGQYDIFTEEVNAYITRLQQAQVRVSSIVCPGLIHGFIRYFGQIPAVALSINFCCQTIVETLAAQSYHPAKDESWV